MNAETPNPQPGDRVRVTPKPFEGELTCDGSQGRLIQVRDGQGRVNAFGPDYATVEVLERALCSATEGATGIRCQQPKGHFGGHKGTTTEQQASAVGYPLFVSWPAEPEQSARRSVRVENTPQGMRLDDRQRIADHLVAGRKLDAVAFAMATGLGREAATAYVEDMPEYQTYLNHHGRTEVDPVEADRMRAMGFDRQPEFKVSDEDRASIQAVLDERTTEYVYGQDDGSWKLDGAALTGVVADIVWAAIRRDRERGDR